MSSQIRRLSTEDANFAEQFRALLAYEEQRDPHVEGAVADIIHAVRKRGPMEADEQGGRTERCREIDETVLCWREGPWVEACCT